MRSASAFAPSGREKFHAQGLSPIASRPKVARLVIPPAKLGFPNVVRSNNKCGSITKVHALPLQTLSRPLSFVSTPAVRIALLTMAAAILVTQYRRIFWPQSQPDPSFSEPIPPGQLGCPLFGRFILGGDKKTGIGSTYRSIWTSLGKPKVFISYFAGSPIAVVTGSENIRPVLDSEFRSPGVFTGSFLSKRARALLYGEESFPNVSNKKEHSFLRRLVGQAMTPSAVEKAMPALQQAATDQITKILESPTTKMIDACHTYTIDVAMKQIIGLKLDESEVATFHKAVNDWMKGAISPRVMFLPGTRFTAAFRARDYLVKTIKARIERLNLNGPDGSTLSAMVYAKDDEGTGKRLTENQLIDNVLLLIFAGSEALANTMTTAMMLLGLHPDVFQKIKEEQRSLISKHGESFTKEQLDNECPYLEAFIKETMRIKPLTGGAARITKNTMVVDGKQIPKGWPIAFNVQITHANDPVTFKEDGSHMDVKKGFKPERWLDDKTRPTTEFMGFGYGYRYCLGANLAMAEMKIFLATVARKVDFDLVGNTESIEWSPSTIIPTPADGTVIAPRVSNVDSATVPAMVA